MDYVEFVEFVLTRFNELEDGHPSGVLVHHLIGDGREEDVRSAAVDLSALEVVDFAGSYMWVKPTRVSTKIKHGGMTIRELWPSFFDEFLTGDQEAFLAKAVEMAHRHDASSARMAELTVDQVFEALGWEKTREGQPSQIAGLLKAAGLIESTAFLDNRITVRPTYAGAVRATRKTQTRWQARLEELLAAGEQPTIDFKRELSLSGVKAKGEFVRDVLGLVTTRAAGLERNMVIGYTDKALDFYESADAAITRDQLEDIINAYTDPKPDVSWITIPVPEGTVGIVVVTRDPMKLPYRVSAPIWKLDKDDVYVRHGTHTEAPTATELANLIAEGKWARGEAED